MKQLSTKDSQMVARLVRKSGTSFYWAMRRLEPRKRFAIYSVYAFCRIVDDIADTPGDFIMKQNELDLWSRRISNLAAQGSDDVVIRGLHFAHDTFGLDLQDLLAVIEGMKTDSEESVIIANETELALYMDRVACAVGRLCVKIFGISEQNCKPLAKAQGEALQITNILRDLSEDAANNRMYIPLDLLSRHGIQFSTNLEDVLNHPNFPSACLELASQAEQRYAEASLMIKEESRSIARPSIMMLHAYRSVFESLQARGWSDVRRQDKTIGLKKAWIALRYGLMGF